METVEELRAELARVRQEVAESQARALESQARALESQALAHERQALALARAARAAAAEVELAAAIAKREEAAEEAFTQRMANMAAQYVAPTVCAEDSAAFFATLPEVPEVDAAAAWGLFCTRQAAAAATAAVPPAAGPRTAKAQEIRDVIGRALSACLASRDDLRLFHDVVVHDGVPVATAKPDFSVTHVRDATSSLLGAVVMVEVKTPGELRDAVSRALDCGRRRVYRLFTEARARGEQGDDAHALVAATDGRGVVLARVDSGAPRAGATWVHAQPCPSVFTAPMKLLPGWGSAPTPPLLLPAAPPAGFAALYRLLAAPLDVLCAGGARPLVELSVVWHAPAAAAGEASVVLAEPVALGRCIARGGTSDVYALAASDGGSVIKVGRCATAEVAGMYAAEEDALAALADTHAAQAGVVPRLLRAGTRQLSHQGANALAGPWRVLLLSPLGTPLEAWLDLQAAYANGAARNIYRLADAILGDVAEALRAAHNAKRVHCDVRAPNVVIVDEGSDDNEHCVGGSGGGGNDGGRAADAAEPALRRFRAVLVDWGVSRAVGTRCWGVGVADCVDTRVVVGADTTTSPVHDYVAAAYLWLSIACERGRPLWRTHSVDESIELRCEWLEMRDNAIYATPREVLAVVRAVMRWESLVDAEAVAAEAAALWPPARGGARN